MKTIIYLFLTCLFLTSCQTSKNVTQKLQTKDSIIFVDKIKVDTIRIVDTKTITEPVDNYIEIPCDSTKFKQLFSSGKSNFKIIKEKGVVKIIYKQDSLTDKYKLLYFKSINKLDSVSKIKNVSISNSTKIIKETFWQSLWSNIWKIVAILFIVMWILGTSLPWILKRIFPFLKI